jgi:hypothetical protein
LRRLHGSDFDAADVNMHLGRLGIERTRRPGLRLADGMRSAICDTLRMMFTVEQLRRDIQACVEPSTAAPALAGVARHDRRWSFGNRDRVCRCLPGAHWRRPIARRRVRGDAHSGIGSIGTRFGRRQGRRRPLWFSIRIATRGHQRRMLAYRRRGRRRSHGSPRRRPIFGNPIWSSVRFDWANAAVVPGEADLRVPLRAMRKIAIAGAAELRLPNGLIARYRVEALAEAGRRGGAHF